MHHVYTLYRIVKQLINREMKGMIHIHELEAEWIPLELDQNWN